MRISDWSSDVCSSDLARGIDVELDRWPPPRQQVALEVGRDVEGEGVEAGIHAGVHLGLVDHRSEEHTSELQSLMRKSYAVFCLKKKKHNTHNNIPQPTNTYKRVLQVGNCTGHPKSIRHHLCQAT